MERSSTSQNYKIVQLSLVGMTLLAHFANLVSFGIKFGIIVAAQNLGCYLKLKKILKRDINMKFID